MSTSRRLWVALVVAPVAALQGAPASAEEPAASGLAALPHGVRPGADGHYYEDVCDHDAAAYCFLHRRLPDAYRPGDSIAPVAPLSGPPAHTMTPTNVLAAYSVPPGSSAGGKIVAIVDSPDQYALSDLQTYRAAFGLPAIDYCPGNTLPNPAGGTPCFASVDQTGGSVDLNIGNNSSNDVETSLDMDMISAACPDCSVLLVQLTKLTDADILIAAQTAVRLGSAATSISIGGPESKHDPTGYSTPGHLVLAAAGDSGYLLGGKTPSYPASSPDILGVGGTTLKQTGSTYGETVWKDTGSGCSTEFPMPAYQVAFGTSNFASCTMRACNDVSAIAYFEDGVGPGGIAIYTEKQGWGYSVGIGGTSAASPLTAAILTRVGLTDAISSDFGFAYSNIASFNDITVGNNEAPEKCSDIMCMAGPGWDGPTGLGTPNGERLAGLGSSSGGDAGSSSGGDAGSSSGGDAGSSSGGDAGSSSGTIDAGSSSGGGDAGSSSGTIDAGSSSGGDAGSSSGGRDGGGSGGGDAGSSGGGDAGSSSGGSDGGGSSGGDAGRDGGEHEDSGSGSSSGSSSSGSSSGSSSSGSSSGSSGSGSSSGSESSSGSGSSSGGVSSSGGDASVSEDAGVFADASTDAPANAGSGQSSGCGCKVPSGGGSTSPVDGSLALGGLALLLAGRRRRR